MVEHPAHGLVEELPGKVPGPGVAPPLALCPQGAGGPIWSALIFKNVFW
jgi:hypothetical protein